MQINLNQLDINILFLFLFIFIIYKKKYKKSLTIYISSCNRYYYLNFTLPSIVKHMQNYESLLYSIVLVDQGTYQLRFYNNLFKACIYNIFYMNPNGYIYSYDVIFSYLYSKYVLLIDDDRPIKYNIEKFLISPNFLEICMDIMDRRNDIYGFILKQNRDGNVKCFSYINTKIKYYCKVEKAYLGYYYSNGASLYKTNILKSIKTYKSEYDVAMYFKMTKYDN